MLTDSSLTNILVVSGVSQIRYRAYSQTCNPTQLLDHLKNKQAHDLTLLKAYYDLTSLSIPTLWQVASVSDEPGKQLTLELWVFWFDERHTGKIDANDYVDALEEIEVGSFTWENAYSAIQSPLSTAGNVSLSNSGVPATLTTKHKLFIQSVRNLVRLEMKRKGALPLGEFYLFPSHPDQQCKQDTPSLLSTSTMLCCSYNLYLTSTNLVFQPNTRRMQIRPITAKAIRTKGKKVMMSPSGETAWIAFNPYSLSSPTPLSPQTENTILERWAQLFDIPYDHLKFKSGSLPSLIALKKSANDDVFYYPTSLIFLSSSTKLSPTAMAGMNGVFGFNQGYSEDLGDRWYRWAWSEHASNYWDYTCPRDKTTSIVLDILAHDHHHTNSTVLQKALNEPVMSSPLMATKSVVTHYANSRTSLTDLPALEQPEEDTAQRQTRIYDQSGISLVEFAMAHFALPSHNQESDLPDLTMMSTTEYSPQVVLPNQPINTPYMHHGLPMQISTSQQLQQQQQHQQQQHQPPPPQPPPPFHTHTSQTESNQMSGTNTAYQSPHMSNMELDSFGIVESMDVDNMVLDMPNRWTDDGMNDLDNFDFGVTEEDFDFFETSAVAAAAATNNTMPLQSQSIIPPISDTMLIEAQDNLMDPTDQDTMMISSEDLDFSFDEKKPDMDKQSPLEMQTRSVQPLQEETPMDLITHEAPSVDQLYVPPQFAPVKFDFMVNDAKYAQGGKFTYTPTTEDQQMINKKHRKSEDYRPDYVPLVRTKKNKKGNINSRRKSSKLILETIHKENKSLTVPCTHDTDEAIADTEEKTSHNVLTHHYHTSENDSNSHDSSSNSSSSSSSDSDSNSSDSNSDSEEEAEHGVIIDDTITPRGIQSDNESTRSENSQLPEEGPGKTKRIMNALQQAQERYIQQLICLKPLVRQKSLRLEQLVMDYDSPFAQAVVSNTIRPNRNFLDDESEENRFRALDHLCQQAVMGGYPFSGGIEAMSSNGFEANEGESAKVIIARRRNLLQKLNGDAIHLPSTPNDVDFMIQHFKDILGEVFHHQQQQKKQTDTIDPMCLDQLPMPSSVTVKGPLSVQQCYDLSEANQAHSKYGKYQVKKRRPAEPNLDTLQPPTITVNRQEESLEGSSRLIMFWEKLRLEPYSSKKHVAYFVLYPKNESVEAHVTHFFRGLSTLYETCQLGAHLPGNTHTYRKGLVPVPLLAAQHPNESMEDRQLRSYMAECQQLGSSLSSMMNENIHIVIYLINPITHLKSHLDLSLCFHKLMDTYHTSISQHIHKTPHKTPARLVLQLMPIEHVLRSTAFGGCLKFGLKEIAFAVYSKCHTVVHRTSNDPTLSIASMDIYSPPFVLSKPVPTQIPFKLKKAIHAFPTLLEDHPVLHMAYSFSFDRKWMVIVWTDNYGELIEFALLDRRQYKHSIFKEAWSRTKQVSKRTGSAWTFVIAKMGLLFEDELKAWMACFQKKSEEEQDNGLGEEERVAIVSIDIESTFHVNVAAYASRLHELNSGDISAATTPTGNSTTSSTASPISSVPLKKMMDDQGQTKALLLNHRVAYSNRRERMSFGMLNMNPISHIEDWMIPLASGYIIHTPPTTENPNNELFNCDPVVLEIHLIYNQTNHSAYSTLRDIIKKYHALSYINVMPSDSNCFPIHIALVERLCRLLLVIHS